MGIKEAWAALRRPAAKRRRFANETDQTFTAGARQWNQQNRDRFDYDREETLRLSLEAWRANPLARRIVELTTQYVVGGGLRVRSDDAHTHAFLEEWWNHRLNLFQMRVHEWCDELTRSGELFLLVSTDAGGMSYVRAVPAAEIESIETAENDVQQEKAYRQKGSAAGEAKVWPAYDESGDEQGEDGSFTPVMLHYAVNRPAGAVHGESDLAPLLQWLSRYTAWLEDRARLNRYRNSFMYVVKAQFQSEEERLARQSALAASPPPPGSILVTDSGEEWSVISPKLESHQAGEDGLALKKMIAAGSGLPLHFLSEPEGSNRSTADSAGGPTYRRFEQRQEFFTWLVEDLARVVVKRRAKVDRRVRPDAKIQVTGADLSARDNAALAVAMSTAVGALGELRNRQVIDDVEMLRMAYRFAGEVADVENLIERGRREGPPLSHGEAGAPDAPQAEGSARGGEKGRTRKVKQPPAPAGRPPGLDVNEDGEITGIVKVK